MTIKVKPAAIQDIGGRMVRYMETYNTESQAYADGQIFVGAVSEFCLIENVETFKNLGVPCELLSKDVKGRYTGVVTAGRIFRIPQ